jgi:ribose transport system permease protein
VIIIGGIDLSVGAVMALAGMICALAMQAGLPIPVAVVCGLLTGSTIGLINGLVLLGVPLKGTPLQSER